MPVFPRLRSGAVTQYPSDREVSFETHVSRFVDGSEQRFRLRRGTTTRWIVKLGNVSAEEIFALEDFFEQNQGQMGSFTFIDPWDETEHENCSFELDQFEATAVDAWRWAGRLVIRKNIT